jgi:hypothetical protein
MKGIKKLKREIKILSISIVVTNLIYIYLLFFNSINFSKTQINIESNFSEKEARFINNTIKSVKDYYFEDIKQINFVKDVIPYCDKESYCYAVNYQNQGKIYIEYSNRSKFIFREAICHEIAHTYWSAKNEEEMVSDVGATEFCFKKLESKKF